MSEDPWKFGLGQLRHAYDILMKQGAGLGPLLWAKDFAEGLISPGIQGYEEAINEIERLREYVKALEQLNEARQKLVDDWMENSRRLCGAKPVTTPKHALEAEERNKGFLDD